MSEGKGKGKPATKKAPKVKKSVLAEQERLLVEAHTAAQAEEERKERERKKRETAATLAAKVAASAASAERVRLLRERASDAPFLESRARDVADLDEQVLEQTEWTKWLQCNPLPDGTSEAALNTYLSMWRDDMDTDPPNVRFKPILDSCSTTERVIDLLEESSSEAREELQISKQRWVKDFVALLRALTTTKIDALTTAFLARYDEYENAETRVMNVAHNTPDIAFGLWSHDTSKRGVDGSSVRVKRIDFPIIGFNVELPAALQKSRTSIRVVRTLFDQVALPADPTLPTATSTKLDPLNEEPPEMPTAQQALASLAKQADELYVQTLASHTDQSVGGGPRVPPIHFVSVGGIISIEQLALPPPPKKAKGWTMRDITPLTRNIQIVPYPAAAEDSTATQSPASVAVAAHGGVPGAAGGGASGAAAALVGGTSQAPLRVSFMLPSYVFLDDREPHFGWWDARHGCWRQEGVSLIKYEPKLEGGFVHLSLNLLKPVAIIQPRALDFPYRAWHIRPSFMVTDAEAAIAAQGEQQQDGETDGDVPPSSNVASVDQLDVHVYELQLQGSRFPVELEIAADHARLTNPISPVLEELNTQHMLPGILLSRMARAGINIQPSIEDAAYCRKPLKNLQLTAALHEHVALVCGVFEVSGCPFNSSRDKRTCMFRVRLLPDSLLLKRAPAKRKRVEEEQQRLREEAEQKEREAAAAAAAADAAGANGSQTARQRADLEKMMAEMEAEEPTAVADAAGQPSVDEAAEAAKAAELAAEMEAMRLAAEAEAPTAEELERATAKRAQLLREWVTIKVELATIEEMEDAKSQRKETENGVDEGEQEQGEDEADGNASSTSTSRPISAATSARAATPATSISTPAPDSTPVDDDSNPDFTTTSSSLPPMPGTVSESVPGGHDLLKFTLVKGSDNEGVCDETPLIPEASVAHCSLRRCLLAYYCHLMPEEGKQSQPGMQIQVEGSKKDLTSEPNTNNNADDDASIPITATAADLAIALDMQLLSQPPMPPSLQFREPKKPALGTKQNPAGPSTTAGRTNGGSGTNTRAASAAVTKGAPAQSATDTDAALAAAGAQQAALASAAEQLQVRFLPADVHTLQIQQTIRRTLNLTNPFTFY